jgi:hypothetical protein
MADQLDIEIQAYEALLPAIKRQHGSVWALIAKGELVATFGVFGDAARYAVERFGRTPVLIRHTDSRRTETAPFIPIPAET